MSECRRVVSIGGHNLDAELLGGPLLIKYAKQGAKVTCANTVMGRLEGAGCTAQEKEAYLEQVAEEAVRAAAALGGDTLWLGYDGSNMPDLDAFADRLERWFTEEDVDLVITHWRGSMHPRHIATHDAVTEAVKRMRRKKSKIHLMYGLTFEDLVGFVPQAYIVLSEDEVRQWIDALSEYAIFRGEVNNFPYAKYYPTNLQIKQIESGSDGPTACYMYASLIENELW